jgi:hypothetical protein
MLYSTTKAIALARDLSDKFNLRLKNSTTLNTVRQTQDANGWPMIFVSVDGNEAEGQPVLCVRIMNINPGSVDIFGNSTLPFAPHQIEFAYELTSGGYPIPAYKDLFVCQTDTSRIGAIMIDKAIANGTAVTEASLNAAAAVVTVNDVDWPNKGV